ncbi:hypothetical protein CHLNCDRAFT_136184 [Chlorella variabilis]|uniref:RING-type domain-containing protein n=1 Tax=Chlorella variabilis TaxID=554065 RepID=E1ZJY5_CHLVA|nr:hypothetical protein CHLNCDRAFT_136184 [Chlorella variabilis]EFN53942.1 hypothetical protein CHLNCDRAFT_136184 [Chlorella variabilis]|eukprot:XP_005846044.1 hypothetical protein CHLNCDRAFT_136184 [Chlorella variabilis]
MLIYLNIGNLGGQGGGGWQIGPLITLLPILLTYGFPLLQSLLSMLFGFGSSNVFVYDGSSGGSGGVSSPSSVGSGGRSSSSSSSSSDEGADTSLVSSTLVAFTSMVVSATLTVLLMRLVVAGRRNGFGVTLRRMFLEGFGGGWGQAAGRGGAQHGGRPAPRTRSQRIEHVAKLMQGLPVESYRSREELERMSVAELKQLLKKRGVACEHCLEKRELVERGAEGGNSSAASCSICCEDYESGDVLRVLPCGHRYHLECVDKWFLASTDYSRPPACPLCSAPLDGTGSSSSS